MGTSVYLRTVNALTSGPCAYGAYWRGRWQSEDAEVADLVHDPLHGSDMGVSIEAISNEKPLDHGFYH